MLSQTCIGVYDGLCAAAHTLQHPFPLCAKKTDIFRSTSEEQMTAVQKQLNKNIIIINNNDDVFLEHQLALLFHLDDEPSAYNVFMQYFLCIQWLHRCNT